MVGLETGVGVICPGQVELGRAEVTVEQVSERLRTPLPGIAALLMTLPVRLEVHSCPVPGRAA